MRKMRIPIREQLSALIVFSSLVGLGVVAVAIWVTNGNFVLEVRSSRLSLTASLKAAQLTSNLSLMQSSVKAVATRVLIQSSLRQYNQGNNTNADWSRSASDLRTALDDNRQPSLLLQAKVFPRYPSGPAGSDSVLNVTGSGLAGAIRMPLENTTGSAVYLGDGELGYPAILYPNLTYTETTTDESSNDWTVSYAGRELDARSTLLLGPLQLNYTSALFSMTVPIVDNNNSDILGWLTIVVDARLVYQVLWSPEGLDETGISLLVGPVNVTNRFAPGILYEENGGSPPSDIDVEFVLAPDPQRLNGHRKLTSDLTFNYEAFPAVKEALTKENGPINNAGSLISTENEQGAHVSLGYALLQNDFVDWIILLEQSQDEALGPIRRLRNILLACIFGTLGAMLLFAFPVAHFSTRPIQRLREATRQSLGRPSSPADSRGFDPTLYANKNETEGSVLGAPDSTEKRGFLKGLFSLRRHSHFNDIEREQKGRRHTFHIPAKVKNQKHFIRDELSELTETFNEMSDELFLQYERLEERVQQRTAELELSKKLAEAANESKTLFIANISHELKTPLNGILGMCAVCMQETDTVKLKRSLNIIYRSGDLLLNLLTDLLTFSKNEMGQQLSLDEREFRMRDISNQLVALFDKQARDGGIELNIRFEDCREPPNPAIDEGFAGGKPSAFTNFGGVKDMTLWGDQHRILQVLINLVSNSLKFTPRGGKVAVTVRCTADAEDKQQSRKTSLPSKNSKTRTISIQRAPSSAYSGSHSSEAPGRVVDHPSINERGSASPQSDERKPSPPPGQTIVFEFQVEDTGPGIPEHLQQRIFEPFVQGDLGLSKRFGGTGLGLSICSQLAKLMRGKITLKSEVGVGSTFTMRIPLRRIHTRSDSSASSLHIDSRRSSAEIDRAAKEATPNTSQTTYSGISGPVSYGLDSHRRLVGLSQPFFTSDLDTHIATTESSESRTAKGREKVKVLVAEDNKVNQEVVTRLLRLEDILDVTLAKDGQEAVEMVKASIEGNDPYSLIFMDVQMPNLDGLQSTRAIRQIGHSAPIVALTAFAEESNIKDCYDSGMNFFLSKPIKRAALKQVLNRYCPPILEADESEQSPDETVHPSPEASLTPT